MGKCFFELLSFYTLVNIWIGRLPSTPDTRQYQNSWQMTPCLTHKTYFRCGVGKPITTDRTVRTEVAAGSDEVYGICSICKWDRKQFFNALNEGQLNTCRSTGKLGFNLRNTMVISKEWHLIENTLFDKDNTSQHISEFISYLRIRLLLVRLFLEGSCKIKQVLIYLSNNQVLFSLQRWELKSIA